MSDHITERPAEETRITLEPSPPPAAHWLWSLLGRAGGLLVLLALLWVFLTAAGCLPRWESDGPIDADLVQPVDLSQVFALAEGHDARPRPWPAEDNEVPLEAALQQLLDNVRHATGKQTLALPVTFSSASSVTSAARIDQGHVNGSILLGRESVRVAHLHDSIVICPGAVEVSHSYRNVIIAGQYLDVSFDGNHTLGGLIGPPDRSLLVCGRKMRIAHARDSITLAPDVSVAHANRILFLHRREGHVSHPSWCRDDHTPGLLAPMPAVDDPLAGKVELSRVYENQKAILSVRAKGAKEEVPLKQGDAHTEGVLAGWRVVFVGPHAALLHDGERWSLLALTHEQETAPTSPRD